MQQRHKNVKKHKDNHRLHRFFIKKLCAPLCLTCPDTVGGVFVAIFFVATIFVANAQQLYLPLNHNLNNRYERALSQLDITFHTSVKPYRLAEIPGLTDCYSGLVHYPLLQKITDTSSRISCKFLNFLYRKLRLESLIIIDTSDLRLTIDPIINFEFSRDISRNENLYINTRGFSVNGSIGDKFSFSSGFYENQGTFSDYLNAFISQYGVVPGQGKVKRFKKNGYDYAMASGYISYTPSKYFNFQFGYDKNFFGDGYRSLLLSDNAFNYPFLKISTNIWKFKYVNLYAQFLDIRFGNTYTSGFAKKYGTFHYLSWDISKKIQFGLFEAVIWQAEDSLGVRGFDVNYLNPVIFLRPVEFSLGSPDNSLLGFNLKFKVSGNIALYHQFILDDFNFAKTKQGSGFFQNKYGFQFGFKMFDLLRINNLYLQSEYNQVRPYTYAHKATIQNYAHYNQALAHPLGANFRESVSHINYQYKDFLISAKIVYAQYGQDSANSHFGKDIFKSDYEADLFSFGNNIGQGIKVDLLLGEVKLGYLINPSTNLKIELGYQYRIESSDLSDHITNFIFIGLKTDLRNFYYDF